jgi:transcriptional regulator with XRE-family HTH domain
MPIERLYDRGSRRVERAASEVGVEFRAARLRLGVTQREVAAAARIDRADYCRIEGGKLANLRLATAHRVASVLGLDLTTKVYPGGAAIRDAGQAPRLKRIIGCIAAPLNYRTEAGLPRSRDYPEQRAWDLMIYGHGERTAIEFERSLRDMQAQIRRHELKRHDDPVSTSCWWYPTLGQTGE